MIRAITPLLLLSSCISQFASRNPQEQALSYTLDEMRLELADLKHQIHSTAAELALLEEQIHENKSSALYASLDRKVAELEKIVQKSQGDIKQLSSYANQTNSLFSQHRDKLLELEKDVAEQQGKLLEVSKVKEVLSSLKTRAPLAAQRSLRVKAGDTLERIAKRENTSVEALKSINELKNDRIFVGQEIKLP